MKIGSEREKEAVALAAMLAYAERRCAEMQCKNSAQLIQLAISELMLENQLETKLPIVIGRQFQLQ